MRMCNNVGDCMQPIAQAHMFANMKCAVFALAVLWVRMWVWEVGEGDRKSVV